MFALIMHLITWRSQRQHLSRRPQSLIPAALSVHLPKQFAALSSHRQCCASEGELRSTPVPMSAIAKKRCRVMVGPPDKGAGRSGTSPSTDLNPASVARMPTGRRRARDEMRRLVRCGPTSEGGCDIRGWLAPIPDHLAPRRRNFAPPGGVFARGSAALRGEFTLRFHSSHSRNNAAGVPLPPLSNGVKHDQ